MRMHADTDTKTLPMATEPATDTMSFRAATLDEAVALAEESLGASVRVVAANRIRRGGIGGFFASDLGVEVSVALDDETIEQALERLVSETAADERTRWMEHRAGDFSAESPTAMNRSLQSGLLQSGANGHAGAGAVVEQTAALPAPAQPDAMTARVASVAPAGLAMPRRNPLATPKIADAVVRIGPREEEPSMVRVEQIIEELHFLTSRADGTEAQPAPLSARSVALPRLPPRAIDIAQAASANAAASHAQALAAEQHRSTFADPRPVSPLVPSLPTPRLPAAAPVQPNPVLPSPAARTMDLAERTSIELDITATTETADGQPVPSQRQVELAVAATDQLIESLQRETGVKRLSVRVVLRTGDHCAVEAQAEWEAS